MHSVVRFSQVLEFHDFIYPSAVLKQRPLPDRIPGCLLTLRPSTLICEDRSTSPSRLYQVRGPGVVVPWRAVSPRTGRGIRDMCYVKHQGRELLLITYLQEGSLHAFSLETGEEEWIARGRPPGCRREIWVHAVTTDGHGLVMVTDTNNNCLQILNSTGQYVGSMLKEEVLNLGVLGTFRWCPLTSTLIVAHVKEGIHRICLAKLGGINNIINQ